MAQSSKPRSKKLAPKRRVGSRVSEWQEPKPRDSLREWLEDRLAGLPDLEIRRMFGGAGVYSEEVMFGILYDGRVFLKVDELSRGAFVEREMSALRARKGTVLTSYYEVPPEVLDDDDELCSWARRALEAARRAPSKVRR